MKSTWNMMNFLKLAVISVHDATKLSCVYENAILKRFMFEFQEIHYIPGFRCNVEKDLRIMIAFGGPLGLNFSTHF